MSDIPDNIYLVAGDHSEVLVICDHADHLNTDFAIAYMGGQKPHPDLPYFGSDGLNAMVEFIRQHGQDHDD